ncbi:MAG: septation protein SepH [Actinomycetota bacterium]|nr:DUF3071 domain-containing protein [Actinomycetota bacterium]
MIKLRVVGATPENDALVLSNKPKGRKGSHVLPIDGRLITVLQGAFDRNRDNEPRQPTSKALPTAVEPPRVAPRELQRMLRAGQSIRQVARATGVDEGYIEQFYPPVLYEIDGIVREAQGLSIEKARRGVSGLPLGEAVDRNLAQRRIRLSDDELARAWSATRREGQPWQITLTFPYRGRSHKAVWMFDPRTRELTATNKAALDIGWVAEGARPVVRDEAPNRTSRKPARARKASTRKKPARKTAKRTARKPARKTAKRTARKPARKTAKRTARKPARKTAKRTARKTAKRTARKKPARRTSKKPRRRSR